MEIFSTITPPVFSEVIIVIREYRVAYLPHKVFETLRTMHKARPFKLVFLLEASDRWQGEVRRSLVEELDSMTDKGLLDFLDSPPTIR